MQFPADFLWGTATSAYQTEGYNTNSDWWYWEKGKYPKSKRKAFIGETSGMACDSYNRYEEDFNFAKNMNNNAIRFSIEWARIEPRKGEWDQTEVEHYKKVIKAAKERGLKTFVTLHHFTKPIWFSKLGGWLNPFAPKWFANYAKKCAEEYSDYIDFFITLNEPQVYSLQAYWRATWTPKIKCKLFALISQLTQIKAHKKAYTAIKFVDNSAKVGLSKHIVRYERVTNDRGKASICTKLVCKVLHYLTTNFFLDPIKKHLDFIGLNYYFTAWMKNFKEKNPEMESSDLGWILYPEGLKHILLNLKKYNLPIYITEHGLADAWDQKRQWYINESLKFVYEAMESGVDVRGYLHWSLIDNFEWHIGFWPKFGLIEIDREHNLTRKPRPSFYMYSQICRTGKVE
ncbi:glycoside hydrolase family 1 protein [Patescibacteria group bacterium]|nr:glycoside hydrolase family 1 protein [Patescibacteria group bacterium]